MGEKKKDQLRQRRDRGCDGSRCSYTPDQSREAALPPTSSISGMKLVAILSKSTPPKRPGIREKSKYFIQTHTLMLSCRLLFQTPHLRHVYSDLLYFFVDSFLSRRPHDKCLSTMSEANLHCCFPWVHELRLAAAAPPRRPGFIRAEEVGRQVQVRTSELAPVPPPPLCPSRLLYVPLRGRSRRR